MRGAAIARGGGETAAARRAVVVVVVVATNTTRGGRGIPLHLAMVPLGRVRAVARRLAPDLHRVDVARRAEDLRRRGERRHRGWVDGSSAPRVQLAEFERIVQPTTFGKPGVCVLLPFDATRANDERTVKAREMPR